MMWDGNFVGGSNQYYYLDESLNGPCKPSGTTMAERGYGGPMGVTGILPHFNLSQYVTMIIGNEKRIGTLSLSGDLSANTSYYADVLYSHTDNASQLNAQPLTINMPASDPNNVLGQDLSVRNRFVSNPRSYQPGDGFLSFRRRGLKGKLNDQWTWGERAELQLRHAGLLQRGPRADPSPHRRGECRQDQALRARTTCRGPRRRLRRGHRQVRQHAGVSRPEIRCDRPVSATGRWGKPRDRRRGAHREADRRI